MMGLICNTMKNIIDSITKLFKDRTNNDDIKFIIRKQTRKLKVNAYKEFIIEVYLHSNNTNILVLEISKIFNTSSVQKEEEWTLIEPYFTYKVIEWCMSNEANRIINEYKME